MNKLIVFGVLVLVLLNGCLNKAEDIQEDKPACDGIIVEEEITDMDSNIHAYFCEMTEKNGVYSFNYYESIVDPYYNLNENLEGYTFFGEVDLNEVDSFKESCLNAELGKILIERKRSTLFVSRVEWFEVKTKYKMCKKKESEGKK